MSLELQYYYFKGFPGGSVVIYLKIQEMQVSGLGRAPWKGNGTKNQKKKKTHRKTKQKKEMATHSSVLAWKIPWTEEPDRLQSMGLQETDNT